MPRSSEHPSTYVVQDRSNLEELERLTIQDQMVTKNMGGVLAEQLNPAVLKRILDVGCGPGGWLIETAKRYPIPSLIGVDISRTMVVYAREQAIAAHVDNRVEFHVMDALRMLEFPSEHFDLVNLRFGVSFLRMWDWPKMLQEIKRVLRPGGIARITDSSMTPHTTSAAQAKLTEILSQAFYKAGHFFREGGDGLISHLPELLNLHGLVDIQRTSYETKITAGTPNAEMCFGDVSRAFRTVKPFLEKWGGVPNNYEDLYRQALEEMQRADFTLSGTTVTVWGYKGSNLSTPQFPPIDTQAKGEQAEKQHDRLTERENDILQLVSIGLSNKEIAEKLSMSQKTVNGHLRSIFSKLHVPNRTAAIGFAFRHGLL